MSSSQERIFVAGQRGMVGGAVLRHLQAMGYADLITRTHADLDLAGQKSVGDFFAAERPDKVYLSAAKVGSIWANNRYPAIPPSSSISTSSPSTLERRKGSIACNGILFSHESPVWVETFVTRKITRALARIKLGLQERLFLGNLNAKRDWGHARDYVIMQWLMLQQDAPEDYVVATGEQHSVRECVQTAADDLGIRMTWDGTGVDEIGIRRCKRRQHRRCRPALLQAYPGRDVAGGFGKGAGNTEVGAADVIPGAGFEKWAARISRPLSEMTCANVKAFLSISYHE